MDPREAGKLGGRPSKAAAARSAIARAVASGSQRTLNFSGNLTLSGTFNGTVNINVGGTGGAGGTGGVRGAGGAGAGKKRPRADDDDEDDDDDDDDAEDAGAEDAEDVDGGEEASALDEDAALAPRPRSSPKTRSSRALYAPLSRSGLRSPPRAFFATTRATLAARCP